MFGLKRFTQIYITFSYRIRITKLLAHWKYCYEGYVMTWYRDYYFFLLLFLHLMIFKKVWFMILGFSCDDTCLSWIELIIDLSMWASILGYIFGFIMEAMMMMLHTFMLWYDTIYDDNACHNDVHSMMLMHSYTIWCTSIP